MSGAPASMAILADPENALRGTKERLIVPSTNMPTTSPWASASDACSNASCTRPPRSTGMCFIPRMRGPEIGCSKISRLAAKRTRRPDGIAPAPTKTKSR